LRRTGQPHLRCPRAWQPARTPRPRPARRSRTRAARSRREGTPDREREPQGTPAGDRQVRHARADQHGPHAAVDAEQPGEAAEVTHDTIPLVLVSVALVANVYVLARHLY